MPRLRTLRTLRLRRATQAGRHRHVAAASGLAAVGDKLYVVADDEHHLAVFDAGSRSAGALIRLVPGDLPWAKEPRKRSKPDFEALAVLPRFDGAPGGALLALGSGSRPNRRRGVVVPLREDGAVLRSPVVVDLSCLYQPLAALFDDVNVEGAFVDGDRLALLQRANKGDARNARVDVALGPLVDALAGRSVPTRVVVRSVTAFDLGRIGGIPLGFTDGVALPDRRFAFTAVAEDTDDSYADGRCAGSAIGIARGGQVLALWRLRPALKVEGIAAHVRPRGLALTVVTDADDAAEPAKLMRAVVASRGIERSQARA
jgi:hypothetical protein